MPELLGKGRYAKVWAVSKTEAEKVVELPAPDSPDRSIELKCLLKEYTFFKILKHPCLMRGTHGSIEANSEGRIAVIRHRMPRAQGTLHETIRNGTYSWSDAKAWMAQLASALAYLHARGVTHGDLKPENVLQFPDRVVLADYTLTTVWQFASENSQSTLHWRPPECVEGKRYSPPSDVWSWGVIFLDLIYGCSYFRDLMGGKSNTEHHQHILSVCGLKGVEQISQQTAQEVHRMRQYLKSRPPFLKIPVEEHEFTNQLIKKCLKLNPADRPSMNDLLKAFYLDVIPARFPHAPVLKDQEFQKFQAVQRLANIQPAEKINFLYRQYQHLKRSQAVDHTLMWAVTWLWSNVKLEADVLLRIEKIFTLRQNQPLFILE